MYLHDKIRKLRKEKGFSQQQLADMLDIHLTHINRLENGHSQPSIEVFKKIMTIFEVSADYLLDDTSDSFEIKIGNKNLADKIKLIDTLDEKDQEALIQVIDSMLTKQKMKELLNNTPDSSK